MQHPCPGPRPRVARSTPPPTTTETQPTNDNYYHVGARPTVPPNNTRDDASSTPAAHTTTPLTPDSHFAALRASTSLQHFRSLLGLKPQFAEPQARNTNPSYMSERSNSILKTKGAFFDIPITDRVAEYERQRQKKLAALRAEKDAAEMAEVTRAHAALRAKLRARSSTPQQPPGSDAPNSWMSGPLGLQPNTGRPSTVPNLHSRAVVRQTRMGIALSGSPYGQCTTRHEAAASLYKLATTTTTPARVRSGRRPGRVKRTKMTSY